MSLADTSRSARLIVPGEVCRDFEHASRLEWLETNHTGAYAMGTVAGLNTRRYHALLISSLKPPAERYSILPRVEEIANVAGVDFSLGAAQYPGVVYPRGFELLDEFRIDPFPEWRYCCGSAAITKTVCLLDRQQSVLVRYSTTVACTLKVRLLTSFRDYHSLAHRNTSLRDQIEITPERVVFTPYAALPPLSVVHSGSFAPDCDWFLRHEYLRELERGLDYEEDLYSPGTITFQLAPGNSAWFLATLEPQSYGEDLPPLEIDLILEAERRRRQFESPSRLESTLKRALDQFRIHRYDGQPSLLAGYPWFTDWSRDILISLPALSASGFAAAETRNILEMLLTERSEGLIPNRFLDTGSLPEYNTADATLWVFVAAQEYLAQTNDLPFLREILFPAALDILDWHRRGTKYRIHIDEQDHLLWAGDSDTQLTWMDARVNGSAITPRFGKPVEINALWYNALRITAAWSDQLGHSQQAEHLRAEAAVMLASFRRAFWNDQHHCLFDVVKDDSPDASIRPNQLFALSLPYPLVDPEKGRLIMAVIKNKLLTPVGLRTLESGDPCYRPRFEGSMAARDSAYHQGTVWPWLMGPFITAYLYSYGETIEAICFCRDLLMRFEQELVACCLGSLAEVYDAEQPHQPGGCPAQLWSIAQFTVSLDRLRVLSGEAKNTTPY